MKIIEIRINPDNHGKWDCDPKDSWNFDKCIDIHNDIVKYLECKFPGIKDLGGKYASFLQDVGIDHQSENGWWSKTAVDPRNIEAFVEYYGMNEDSEFNLQYGCAVTAYKLLKKAGFVNNKYRLVKDLVQALLPLFDLNIPA